MDTSVPGWDEYIMEIAKTVSMRSKDPSRKVGAVLVADDNRIIGTGYNGFAPGELETPELWSKPFKYAKVQHAEINCINFSFDLDTRSNVRLYTTCFPCKSCMTQIVKHPITKIFYLTEYSDTEESRKIAKKANIVLEQVKT